MGNEQCCDDKYKAGQFSNPTEVKSSKILQKINTQDAERQFYSKYPKTRNTINSNNEGSSPKKEDSLNKDISNKLMNVFKGDQSISQQDSKKPSFDRVERLSFSNSNENKKDQQQVGNILKIVPQLIPQVKKIIHQQKFFSEVEIKDLVFRQYGNQIYEGQIQDGKPNGFGKFYKHDNSFYIGYFEKGKAHGKGAYVFNDGSYYHGNFIENRAQGQGEYFSKDLNYIGSFKNNLFHGKGQEEGTNHSFNGDYANGFKATGVLSWSQNTDRYKYEGTFNEKGLFHGNGQLEQPTGTYQGQFENGFKHGIGTYKFNNLITYHGDYHYNIKEGHGKLSNPGGRLAYEGQFKDGLPHGKGFIPGKNNTKQPSSWIMGIDSSIL